MPQTSHTPTGEAMPAKKPKMIGLRWLTKRKTEAIIHMRAQRVLGISGKAFVTKYRNGEYKNLDSGSCPGIIELALLVPEKAKKTRAGKNRKRSIHHVR